MPKKLISLVLAVTSLFIGWQMFKQPLVSFLIRFYAPEIEISDVSGTLPWNVKIKKLTLKKGVHLIAQNIQWNLNPWFLFRGKIYFRNIIIDSINVSGNANESSAAPSIPKFALVMLDRLSVDTLQVKINDYKVSGKIHDGNINLLLADLATLNIVLQESKFSLKAKDFALHGMYQDKKISGLVSLAKYQPLPFTAQKNDSGVYVVKGENGLLKLSSALDDKGLFAFWLQHENFRLDCAGNLKNKKAVGILKIPEINPLELKIFWQEIPKLLLTANKNTWLKLEYRNAMLQGVLHNQWLPAAFDINLSKAKVYLPKLPNFYSKIDFAKQYLHIQLNAKESIGAHYDLKDSKIRLYGFQGAKGDIMFPELKGSLEVHDLKRFHPYGLGNLTIDLDHKNIQWQHLQNKIHAKLEDKNWQFKAHGEKYNLEGFGQEDKLQKLIGNIAGLNIKLLQPVKFANNSLSAIKLNIAQGSISTSALSNKFFDITIRNILGVNGKIIFNDKLLKANWTYEIREPIKASIKGEANWSADQFSWKIDGFNRNKIDLHGAGNIATNVWLPMGAVSGSLKGKFNLRAIEHLLTPRDNLNGDVEVNLQLLNTIWDPKIKGSLKIDNAQYQRITIGLQINKIQAICELNQEDIVINKIQAQDASKGTIRGNAKFNWRTLATEARLDLNKFIVVDNDLLYGVATGTLNASGVAPNSKISGDIKIEEFKFYIEDLLTPSITKIPLKQNIVKPPEKIRFFPLALKLKGENIEVKGIGVKSFWSGELEVTDYVTHPLLLGALSLKSGEITMLDKVLKLTQGKINFAKHIRNIPSVIITGQKDIGDGITAKVTYSGQGESFKVDLSSSPALKEEEILSRMLFGKGLGQLSIFQSLQLASIAGNFQGKKRFDFFGRIRKSFGLSNFDFKQETSPNDEGEISEYISVGKRFGEKFSLNYDQGINSNRQRVSGSYSVSPNLSLDLEASASTGSGVGFEWSKRY